MGSKDPGEEPSIGAGLVLSICQASPFTTPWTSCLPGPQLLLSRSLGKGPGAIWAGSVPISSKEALPALHTSKVEVSLTFSLGNLGSQALPAHLALKGKMLTEVGPGETVQVLWTGKQNKIWVGQVRVGEKTGGGRANKRSQRCWGWEGRMGDGADKLVPSP